MSVAINPSMNSVNSARDGESNLVNPVAAAEVWDLDRVSPRGRSSRRVRTLSAFDRKDERLNAVPICGRGREDDVFETHRERKEGVVLAGILSAALLIGSAFGGVFSGSEPLPTTAGSVVDSEIVAAR